MKCLKCNREIPEDARLCPYCGTSVIKGFTDKQREKQKLYSNKFGKLKEFITKSPLDINKSKVLDWSTDYVEQKAKTPPFLYIIVVIIVITISSVILFASLGLFK